MFTICPYITVCLSNLQEERVSGMFSATFPTAIQTAAAKFLNNYVYIVVGVIGGACDDVQQIFIPLERGEKREKLIEIINPTRLITAINKSFLLSYFANLSLVI